MRSAAIIAPWADRCDRAVPARSKPYTPAMTKTSRIVLFLLLVGAFLAGCGNKGDLVLPDPPEPAATEAPASQ